MVFSVPALALISIIFVNFMAQKYRQMKQIYGPLRKQQKIHEILIHINFQIAMSSFLWTF